MDSESRPFALLVELYRRRGRIVPQRERLNVSGPVEALSRGMLDELARHKPALASLLGTCASAAGATDGVPLSRAQQEIWAVERASPCTTRFNLTSSVLLHGRFNAGAASDALSALIERHTALRTRFVEAPCSSPRQFVCAAVRVAPEIERGPGRLPNDHGALLRRVAVEQMRRPFDLAGDPLLDLHVLETGDGHALLTLRRHHIASDGVSFAVVVDEFCRLYRAFAGVAGMPEDDAPPGYPAFVAYETATVERQGRDALRAWWRDELVRGAALAAAANRPSAAMLAGADAGAPTFSLRFVVDAPTVAGLRTLSRRCGESLYSTMFALFRLLLDANDAPGAECVGVDASMRDAAEFERTVGLFVNRVPIVYAIDPDTTFESTVASLGGTIRAALAHKWLAHHEIASLANVGGGPLFGYLFGFHNNPHATFALPGCRVVTDFAHREHEHDLPFVCYLTDVGAAIAVTVAYRAMPHAEALAADFAASYLQLARLAVVSPDARCSTFVASVRARRRGADAAHRRAFADLKRRRALRRTVEADDA
ncbi:condensation domain-containing protein [Burkholderia ubonensis]|uniref:Condensation domain-containing protein n=1 Tax=Burkholderia ubonensis TaxID=101571 RepID=A0AAW3MUL0_9BURK|nr:condensation domain-containing protein [Burkholderia ubonensis]KVL13213.1 hypothetical protein WJ45_33355 [Burkholderia ubonensis]KVP94088.1 hypothetical protein WJ96_13100 [Burkholderia ubonensis]KVQ49518.1 hypothetical protein WK04_06935 [Burkholderia ubonensis]KVX25308.1 hypothetical protein WL02_31025 [Burkholderia ubonensis]KVZ89019.1 hypothetical protein WL25_23655 [Burkholderia ubonensis]